MLVAPVDDAALARMRGLLVEQVVVPSASLGGEQPEQLLAPFTLQSGDAHVRGRRNQRAVRSPDFERRPGGATRATTARGIVGADVRA